MGYHIIIKHTNDDIEHHYVDRINDLANYDIQKDSIVYQGEKSWKPILVGNSEYYANFAYDWHRAGIKAQELFKKQALKEEYILEELNQDSDSFKNYTGIKKEYLQIKRGDFLIRNVKNIEVDVKCRSFYTPVNSSFNCFDFNAEHLQRHLNMQKFTKTPIVIAVYERKKGSDSPVPDSLRMIDISHLNELVDTLKLKKKTKENKKGEKYEVYQIPVRNTAPKFKLIEQLKPNL